MPKRKTSKADGNNRWTVDDIVSAGPGTYESPEALVARIAEVSGFTPTSPTAISGHISRRGRYTRESPDGTLAIVSGSPLLDGIASPAGEVVVGGQVVQPPSIGPTRAAATVCQPGPYEGLETCFSEDGTTLEIRSWDGSFARFHSWKESGIGHWSLGTSITVRGPHFQRAAIDSRYYFPAFAQTCNVIYDNDHDANDSYMAESEEGWGFNADSARRVESLCRIQWNGYRLRGIVSAGESCLPVSSVREFPAEYPDDWPAIEPPPSLTISPTRLEFTSRATSPRSTKRVRVSSAFDTAVKITVTKAVLESERDPRDLGQRANPFSNVFGRFTIPPKGHFDIGVNFDGSVNSGAATTALGAPGDYRGSFHINSDQESATVRLRGHIADTQTLG
jgi:hypothetical protein